MADTPSSTSDSSSIIDNPTSKCSKKAKLADTIDEDVISSLPDAILCHILSFIPTKHAVATSVLSKRWKLLWTWTPNLDFTYNHPVNQSNFMNFVDRVLSLNSVVHVRKVYLQCTEECDSSRVKAWTSAIVGRDAKDFSLTLPLSCCIGNLDEMPRMISLPDGFFIRQNLVELWLDCIAMKVPALVYLPNVKTIRLESVQFLDNDSMKDLLAGCPVLEKLSLERGRAWDNAQTLYICSSSLSYLTLHTEYCDNKNSGYKVVIEAPNLRSLRLTDFVNVDYDMNNISSLESAYLNFEQDGRVARDGDAYDERLYELFSKISHIKNLSLSTFTMDALEDTNFENLPLFNNLTSLKDDYADPHFDWYEPQSVPQCLLSSLENIHITGLRESDNEMDMVHYFLNNAMVLKKMVIMSINLDMKTEIDILKLLVEFPRTSSTCQVGYSNYITHF